MELPHYKKSKKIGKLGVSILESIVEDELNWFFRENHQENDFGIDAYIDIINDNGHITGKSIAIQIKSGESYFKNKTEFGWKYYGELKHLNYYLNHDLPVVLILVDVEIKVAYWVLCEVNQIDKTGTKWSITVPFNQILNLNAKNELLSYVGPIINYEAQLEHFWERNKSLKTVVRLIFVVSRDDIENGNYGPLIEGLKRLENNKELLYTHKENVEISIYGYDFDKRELFDIDEVKKWVMNIFENVKGLPFFLVNDESAQFLKLLLFCNINIKKVEGSEHMVNGILQRKIEFDSKEMGKFLEILYYDLNLFCLKNSIPVNIIEKVSENIINCFSEGEYTKRRINKA